MEKDLLEKQLFEIKGFKFLTETMYKLEESNLIMNNRMKLVLEALNELQRVYKDTLTKSLGRLESLPVDTKILLKFAPLTNCEIKILLSNILSIFV